MRNLKRALSMALAAVMVLGLMVVGASAASYNDFTDKDEIVHKDAVAMVTELGVLAGLPDGSFGGTQNIDRASFARLVCVVLNGGKEPVLGNITTTFTDTQGNWAEAYIAYCVDRGIIAGRGDGTFGPSDNVTGSEAAKMLLVALGYDCTNEGIGGATWQTTTDVLANQAGLYEDLETLNTSEALTRDDAAQMIYNVLNAETVTYSYTYTANGTTTVLSKTGKTLLEDKFGVVIVEGVVVGNEFGGTATSEGQTRIDVTNYEEGQDNFTNTTQTFNVSTGEEVLGRSVALYVKPSSTASSSASRATVVGSAVISNDNVVVTDLSSDSIDTVADDNKLSLGASTQYYDNYTLIAEDDDNANLDLTTAEALIGQGVEKIIIDNDDDGVVDYVFVNHFDLGKVTRYSTDGDGAIVVRGTTSTDEYEAADVIGFDDVARNDYVLYAEIGGKLYVEKPETITGTLELYKTSSGKTTALTIDGTEYKVSTMAAVHSDLTAAATYGADNIDTEATFYLDRNGYIVAVGDVEESAYAYAYVIATAAVAEGNTLDADRVKVTLPDGTTAIYNLDDSGSYLDIGDVTEGNVYRYSINSDGEIRLTNDVTATVSSGSASFTNGKSTVDLGSNGTAYATANTLFFYADEEGDTPDVYTGYNNAPSTEDGTMTVWKTTDTGRVVAVTVIGGTGTTSASNSLFIYSTGGRNNDYVIANVVLAGDSEVTTGIKVAIGEGDIDTASDVVTDTLYLYSINSDGEYVLKSATSSTVTGTVTDVFSGSFVLDNSQEYGLTSDTVIVDDVNNPSTPAVETGSGISEGDYVTIIKDSDNDAVMIIITDDDMPTYTVSFNANGGTGSVASIEQNFYGEAITLPAGTGLTRAGYTFAGWSTTDDGSKLDGTTYAPTANTTLYAVWTANTVSGTVEVSESSTTTDVTISAGNTFTDKKGGETIEVTLSKSDFVGTETISVALSGIDDVTWTPETASSGSTVTVTITLPAQENITSVIEDATLTITVNNAD